MVKRLGIFFFAAALAAACSPVEIATNDPTEVDNNNGNNNNNDNNNSGVPQIQEPLEVQQPSGDPSGSYDETSMLENIHAIIHWTYNRFKQDARAMEHFIGLYCDAIGTGDEDAAYAEAEQAFYVAATTWSAGDFMMMGPAHNRGSGQGLRDEIYSWKEAKSPCAVDQEAAKVVQDLDGWELSASNVQYKGMDVLEYLLFEPSLDSVCGTTFAPDNTPPSDWSSASDEDKKKARCIYSKQVATQLIEDAETIATEWQDYKDTFLDGDFNQNERRSLDGKEQIYHALALYSDKRMKELKIYLPYGQQPAKSADGTQYMDFVCGKKVICPEELEAPFTRKSKEFMLDNMLGFDMLFYGVGPTGSNITGPGFRDLLHAAQGTSNAKSGSLTGPQIHQGISSAADSVTTQLNGISGTMWDQISQAVSNNNKNIGQDLIGAFDNLTAMFRDHIGKGTKNVGGITDMVLPQDMDGDGDG